MGIKYSQLHYKKEDLEIKPSLELLAKQWGRKHICLLSSRLRQISFNFCLSQAHFADLLQLQKSEIFSPMVLMWFEEFKNTPNSNVINGLEFLTGLAIVSKHGKLNEKAETVFDLFDFDETGSITRDELMILFKSAIRGLTKFTTRLGRVLKTLCPVNQIELMSEQCFNFSHVELDDEIGKEDFLKWVKLTPKITYLIGAFVTRDSLDDMEAAIIIQRCVRGTIDRRRLEKRQAEERMKADEELNSAASTIQLAVIHRKSRREELQKEKIELNSLNGGIFSWGSNLRYLLGHEEKMQIEECCLEPKQVGHFKNYEIPACKVTSSILHAGIIDDSGRIYSWGMESVKEFSNQSKRGRIVEVQDLSKVSIKQIAFGNRHFVALCNEGDVYTWGSGEMGQLGHGDIAHDEEKEQEKCVFKYHLNGHTGHETPYVPSPARLLVNIYFASNKVSQIACGYYFTVALTENGWVYSWGEGSEGQLGIGYDGETGDGSCYTQVGYLDEYLPTSSFTYVSSPVRILGALENEHIGRIAVGGNHVIALTECRRKVYEWGAWNRRKGDEAEPSFSPGFSTDLSPLYLDKISLGTEHALAIAGRLHASILAGSENEPQAECYGINSSFGVGLSEIVEQNIAMVDRNDVPPEIVSFHFPVYEDVIQETKCDHDGKEYQEILIQSVKDRGVDISDKAVLIDRGRSEGEWIRLEKVVEKDYIEAEMKNDTQEGGESPSKRKSKLKWTILLEYRCVPATFGPQISSLGISAACFYPAEKVSTLKYYRRPEEIRDKIVLLDFDQSDILLTEEDEEPSALIGHIMREMLLKVKDAQRAGAKALIIMFDFHNFEPFPLQDVELNETIEGKESNDTSNAPFNYTIPVAMVGKITGNEIKEAIEENQRIYQKYLKAVKKNKDVMTHPMKTLDVKLFLRKDVLAQKVIAAQTAGAKAVIVGQNDEILTPIRMMDESVNSEVLSAVLAYNPSLLEQLSKSINPSTKGSVSVTINSATNMQETSKLSSLIHIPVAMISHEDYNLFLKILISQAKEGRKCSLILSSSGPGDVYAWGYGDDGRLGLGDTENTTIFSTGYDRTSDCGYQFVSSPELIESLVGTKIIGISCGEEHSGAISDKGEVFTWGVGESGRLGHGDEEDEVFPRKVESLQRVKVIEINCGEAQTHVVTQSRVLRHKSNTS